MSGHWNYSFLRSLTPERVALVFLGFPDLLGRRQGSDLPAGRRWFPIFVRCDARVWRRLLPFSSSCDFALRSHSGSLRCVCSFSRMGCEHSRLGKKLPAFSVERSVEPVESTPPKTRRYNEQPGQSRKSQAFGCEQRRRQPPKTVNLADGWQEIRAAKLPP